MNKRSTLQSRANNWRIKDCIFQLIITTLPLSVSLSFAANAQVSTTGGFIGAGGSYILCQDGNSGNIFSSNEPDKCRLGLNISSLKVGPAGAQTILDGNNGFVTVGGQLTANQGVSVQGGGVNIANGDLTVGSTAAGTGDVRVGGFGSFGSLTVRGGKITDVGAPTDGTDAANKAYVDAQTNGGNKSFTTLVVNSTSKLNGGATFGTGAGQSTFDANGNLIVNGTGPAQFNNGATFTGATTVNGGAFTANAGAVVNNGFTSNGPTTLNGATTVSGGAFTANAGAVINNGLTVSGTTNLNGQTNINGGGLTVNGGVLTAQKGIVSNGPNSLNGATAVKGGTFTANAGATVNNGFTSNGSTQVNGATTLNGNVAVTSGNTIDAGGNRIQDVAAPVAGTDAVNKDYVDAGVRRLDRRIDKAEEGIAVASSLANPDRTGDQTWAVAVNWGNYEGNNAVGVSGIAAIGRDFFATGDQVSLGGAVGFSTDGGQVAGRVSVQIAGGGRPPLK